ncbi:LysR family transcriptional regulator [Acetobacter persici]|uniref:LysR family transcriptional regulator n=1 Tax=Acetobacter persici TaxID=1076596 RepID=UPI001BAA2E1D|nr:LysR substrate-binding domain-containing protein [Acetobacter persici]MBS1016557.1 LysR family transcriptional regulator [Acetobacter persici]
MALKSRQIEAFKNVMISGGITAAAEAMHITQPAVSRLIHDLEMNIGISLFERRGIRLLPSPEAILLFREVERLYLGLEQIERAANDIRRHKNVVLRVACVSSLMRPFLHEAVLSEIGTKGTSPLVIDIENSRYIIDMVLNNRYDLGFVFGSPYLAQKDSIQLCQSSLMAVMPPDHALAGRESITLQDIQNSRLIIPGGNSPLRFEIDRILTQKNIILTSAAETSVINCCLFAADGMGIGLVDQVSVIASGAHVQAVPIVPEIIIAYFAIRPPNQSGTMLSDKIIATTKILLSQKLLSNSKNFDI